MGELIKLKLHPNDHELFRLLSEDVDDAMLWEIAEADRNEDVDLHLKALIEIRNARAAPKPLTWHPLEVLRLCRWHDPDNLEYRDGSRGERGHLMRAFCCQIILKEAVTATYEEDFYGENVTLAQLLSSVSILGTKYERATLQFLAWCLEHLDTEYEERLFFLLGVLYLRLKVPHVITDAEIEYLADTLVNEENRIRTNRCLTAENAQWLLGLSGYRQRDAVWSDIGRQLIELAEEIQDKKVRRKIIQIGHNLTLAK